MSRFIHNLMVTSAVALALILILVGVAYYPATVGALLVLVLAITFAALIAEVSGWLK